MNRRDFLKISAAAGAATFAVPGFAVRDAQAHALAARRYVALAPGLSDPALQPKFVELAPNALDPGYVYEPDVYEPNGDDSYTVAAGPGTTETGHLSVGGLRSKTDIFGYASEAEIEAGGSYLWPGKTFEIAGGREGISTQVHWKNELGTSHILPVDTNLHWCYSLPGAYGGILYSDMTIADQGVPMIPHLHGKDSAFEFDGNPEFFFTPTGVLGPQWFENGLNGFEDPFVYDDNVPAGTLWYHDHALGITRLNVYAGLAGFYIVRDKDDPGNNPRVLAELGLDPAGNSGIGLPQGPYELAYAIQDRMFTADGQLFYPAYPGDPFYADFIATPLTPPEFPDDPNNVTGNGGGPTALAEFFGDHMVVNGKLWPTATTGEQPGVEPRHYRMRLLNGCDSRFLAIRFRPARSLASTDLQGAGRPLPFWVIGSDQGLAAAATQVDSLIIAPGERYDIVIDFAGLSGQRVIMENIANDAPFAGNPRGSRAGTFRDRQTDRIMAFDVTLQVPTNLPVHLQDSFVPANVATAGSAYKGNTNTNLLRTRKVALFEGMDEYGRLQPLLGTAEPSNVLWPVNDITAAAGLAGQPMEGSIAWHSPTTENPVADVNGHEIWEIYNATPDAHPVHLHLVNFEILDRQKVKLDVAPQPVIQHNSTTDPLTWGTGFKIVGIKPQGPVIPATGVEKAPKDMVIAYPGEVTRIKVTFDKAGRYVWHCHILSHEDHEMMRVMQVMPLAAAARRARQLNAAEVDAVDAVDASELTEKFYVPFVGND